MFLAESIFSQREMADMAKKEKGFSFISLPPQQFSECRGRCWGCRGRWRWRQRCTPRGRSSTCGCHPSSSEEDEVSWWKIFWWQQCPLKMYWCSNSRKGKQTNKQKVLHQPGYRIWDRWRRWGRRCRSRRGGGARCWPPSGAGLPSEGQRGETQRGHRRGCRHTLWNQSSSETGFVCYSFNIKIVKNKKRPGMQRWWERWREVRWPPWRSSPHLLGTSLPPRVNFFMLLKPILEKKISALGPGLKHII